MATGSWIPRNPPFLTADDYLLGYQRRHPDVSGNCKVAEGTSEQATARALAAANWVWQPTMQHHRDKPNCLRSFCITWPSCLVNTIPSEGFVGNAALDIRRSLCLAAKLFRLHPADLGQPARQGLASLRCRSDSSRRLLDCSRLSSRQDCAHSRRQR